MLCMDLPNQNNLTWAPQFLMKNMIASINNKDEINSLQIIKFNGTKNFEVNGSIPINFKITSLAWSSENCKIEESTLGTLIVGSSEGSIGIYSASNLIKDPNNCLIFEVNQIEDHSIDCIEINPFKQNLVALSGKEVYIYNLNNCREGNALFKPGKMNPHEGNPITSIAWNKNVQFILASASDNCLTTVWDLKQNKPIYHFSEPSSVVDSFNESQFPSSVQRKVSIAWNPEIATQIAVAICNSANSSINIWDLRSPSRPILILNTNNSKFLNSMSWCNNDSTYISATSNEDRYYLWNSKTGEPILEQSCISGNIKWSNLNPGLFSISNSMNSQILSFQEIPLKPGNEKIIQKWLESKKGICCFGFGGKLIHKVKKEGKQLQISMIKANSELINKAKYFDSLVREKTIFEICQIKSSNKNLTPEEQCQWKLIKSVQTKNINDICETLGLEPKTVLKDCEKYIDKKKSNNEEQINSDKNENNFTTISQDDAENFFSNLGRETNSNQTENLRKTAKMTTGEETKTQSTNSNWNEDIGKLIKDNLIIDNLEGAIDACLKCGRKAEALFFASYGSEELLKKTREKFIKYNDDRYLKNVIKPLLDKNYEQIYNISSELNWKEVILYAINHNSDNGISVAMDMCNILLKSKNIEGAIICCIIAKSFEKTLELMLYQLKEKAKQFNTCNYLFEMQKMVEKAYSLKSVLENYDEKNHKYNELIGEYCTILVNHGLQKEALKFIEQIDSKSTEKCYRIKNLISLKYSPSKAPFKIISIYSKFQKNELETNKMIYQTQKSNQNFQNTNSGSQSLNKVPVSKENLKSSEHFGEEKKDEIKQISSNTISNPSLKPSIPNLSHPAQIINQPFSQKNNSQLSQNNSAITNTTINSINFQKSPPSKFDEKTQKTIFNPGQSKVDPIKDVPKFISSSISGFTPPPIKSTLPSTKNKNKEQKNPSQIEFLNPKINQQIAHFQTQPQNDMKSTNIPSLQKQEIIDEHQIDFSKIP